MAGGTDGWWPARGLSWRSGRWTLELRDDELADISYDDVLVLRSVRAVVRDRDWQTAPLVVDDVRDHADTLALTVHSVGLGSSFAGSVRVALHDAALEVTCDLVSDEAFDTNRTGLVVLHPPTLAGAPLHVTHASADPEETVFPPRISPHQPVRDIARLRWDAEGVAIALGFAGDVFEMEDQRNWTDASFKTYSRPLELPFPYRIDAGERVTQRVRLEAARIEAADAAGSPTRRSSPELPTITLRPAGDFPRIGVGAATAPDPERPPDLVAEGIGSHVVVELDLADASWPAALARAARGGVPLDARIVLADDDPAALDDAVRALRGVHVVRVAAFAPTGPARHVSDVAAVAALRAALRRADRETPVVGGTRAHFTELNREFRRLPTGTDEGGLDGIVFSSTPLFHSTGTHQLVEAVAIQRRVAHEAVGLAAGLPVHIGPVTLRPRFNDVATTPPPRSGRTDLAAGYGAQLLDADDPRQSSPELAAWTVASAAAFAVPGVDSVTFFEQWGPRGIQSADGVERPVAAAIRALIDAAGPDTHPARLLHGDSPDGLLWALGGATPDGGAVVAANLDRVPRAVRIVLPETLQTPEPRKPLTLTLAAGTYARVALTPPSRPGSRVPG